MKYFTPIKGLCFGNVGKNILVDDNWHSMIWIKKSLRVNVPYEPNLSIQEETAYIGTSAKIDNLAGKTYRFVALHLKCWVRLWLRSEVGLSFVFS